MSYNLNYGLAGDPAIVDAIRRESADVVLLQETNPEWARALRQELGATYRAVEFRHAGKAGGTAILSKFPIEEVRIVRPPVLGSWFPAMIGIVRTPGGPLQFANVHLRPQISDGGSVISGYFQTPKVREAEMRWIVAALERSLPTLVAGDFNESRGAALAVLEEHDFEDGVRAFAPDGKTWRWTTSVGRIESQLDHIVYDRRIDPLEVRIIEAGRSDHLPVVAHLVLQGRTQ